MLLYIFGDGGVVSVVGCLVTCISLIEQVTGILTQGRGDGKEWVTAFLLSYSSDGENWQYVADYNDVSRVSLQPASLNKPPAAHLSHHTKHKPPPSHHLIQTHSHIP